jgi:hypothetical protein
VVIPGSGCLSGARREPRLVLSDWLEEHGRAFEAWEQRLLASGAPLWRRSGDGNGPTHRRALVNGDVVIDLGLFPGPYRWPLTSSGGVFVARDWAGTWTVVVSGGAWRKQGPEDWRTLRAGPVSGLLPPEQACVVAAQMWMASGR